MGPSRSVASVTTQLFSPQNFCYRQKKTTNCPIPSTSRSDKDSLKTLFVCVVFVLALKNRSPARRNQALKLASLARVGLGPGPKQQGGVKCPLRRLQ